MLQKQDRPPQAALLNHFTPLKPAPQGRSLFQNPPLRVTTDAHIKPSSLHHIPDAQSPISQSPDPSISRSQITPLPPSPFSPSIFDKSLPIPVPCYDSGHAPTPTIIVTEGLEDVPFAWLRENAHVIEVSWKDPEKLHAALKEADALIVRTYTQVNDALLAHGPKLKVVGRAGVGLDNIDQPACHARGIEVISTPTANSRAVCEYVFNLIFTLARPIVNLTAPISDSEFHTYRKIIRGLELSGKTMGILGMGRIGRGVGKIAWAMEMNVIYNDLIDVSAHIDYPALSVDKLELYARADILTLHVNHQPANLNYHLIDAGALQRLKPTAILVNTCRGEVVDAHALADALKSHRLAGACIDVHDPEPPPPDYPLWGAPNLIFAPHLAARTQGAMDRMSWVVRDVVKHLQRHG